MQSIFPTKYARSSEKLAERIIIISSGNFMVVHSKLPIMELPINQIILGDAIETMRLLPDASIDSIISDPPYGTTAHKWDKPIDWGAWWVEANRITKPSSTVCLFSAQPFTTDLICSNRKNFRYEIIWEKTMAMGFLDANIRPLKSHENILIFCQKYKRAKNTRSCTYNPQFTQGKPYKTKSNSSAVWSGYNSNTKKTEISINHGTRYPRSVLKYSNNNYKSPHPTAKPLDLLKWLILSYSNPSDLVLDPFIGSGTTALASIETGRNFIGVEKDAGYYAVAQSRVVSLAA